MWRNCFVECAINHLHPLHILTTRNPFIPAAHNKLSVCVCVCEWVHVCVCVCVPLVCVSLSHLTFSRVKPCSQSSWSWKLRAELSLWFGRPQGIIRKQEESSLEWKRLWVMLILTICSLPPTLVPLYIRTRAPGRVIKANWRVWEGVQRPGLGYRRECVATGERVCFHPGLLQAKGGWRETLIP